MGYSGLIYAAIVAAWAAFLVPRWVRRNEEVERAREADTARGVRVLQRRSGPMHAPHASVAGADQRTVLHGDEAGLSVGAPVGRDDGAATRARAVRDVVGDLDAAFAEAARRRRRILALLLMATTIALVTAFTGRAPGWLPLVTIVLTGSFLFVARRAAVAQARRRRLAARRRPAGPKNAVWASAEPAESADGESVADDTTLTEGRRLLIPDEADEAVDPHGWQPVPVPLPTYVTKPKAPRVERTIDLSRPGSWTSGRLDPVGSVELPRREQPDERSRPEVDERPAAASQSEVEAESEEHQEHRRAVGD